MERCVYGRRGSEEQLHTIVGFGSEKQWRGNVTHVRN